MGVAVATYGVASTRKLPLSQPVGVEHKSGFLACLWVFSLRPCQAGCHQDAATMCLPPLQGGAR